MSETTFDVTNLINDFMECLGLEPSEQNFLSSFMDKVIEVIVKIFGSVAEPFGKVWNFLKYPTDLTLINEAIEELNKILTKPAEWLFVLINVFEDIKTPIPEIPLGLFDLSIHGNKAYRDLVAQYNLTSDQIINKFSSVVRFIVGIITSCVSSVTKYITDLMDIINGIVEDFLNPEKLAEWINKAVLYFIELVAPAVKIVNGWIESLIGLFETDTKEIEKIKNGITKIILDVVTGAVDFTQEMLDNLDKSLHPKIKQIVRFIICLLKFVVNLIVYLFSFGWL
jgi:predicted PurR-regulated permease PerM